MVRDVVDQSRDYITVFIEEKLKKMSSFVPECSIHRIPKRLLNMNPMAYIPKAISIGPFHHDQQNFIATEELKLRFFNSYRCRVGLSVQNIVEKARVWEKTARQYYSESINMDQGEFVKMLILDGCFLVEFMIMDLTKLFPQNKNKVHSSFYKAIRLNMSVELLMLENQLPFFVLQHLFDLIYPTRSKNARFSTYDKIKLFELVVHRFLNGRVLPIRSMLIYKNTSNQKPRHLLDFLNFYFVPSKNKNIAHEKRYLPPSATKLREAGVIFKKVEVEVKEDEICITDISFENGILKIPPLVIDDAFEICARNLLAFAQCNCEEDEGNAIHYFEFLDELISTEKDVNLLVKEGIIMNHIGGSDREISEMFNSICRNITLPYINCFSDIGKDLQKHCENRRNKWMASLRHNYFNTPWAHISFFAATFLIILTFLQTIFTGMSTFK